MHEVYEDFKTGEIIMRVPSEAGTNKLANPT